MNLLDRLENDFILYLKVLFMRFKKKCSLIRPFFCIRCTQCVSSDFPCDWCVTGHRCTHDTGENCRNDVLVTGVSVSNISS